MIKSKKDIKDAITAREAEIATCETPDCYNAAWCAGYIHAMEEVLARWYDFYESQKLANAMEDAQDHLWNFLSREVCLTDDECDQRVDHAIEDGAIRRIARCFLNNHDCNVAENDQYYSIICNMYYDENQFH